MVHPVGSIKYDILAGIMGAAVFAGAKFHPILGFTIFIVIVVFLPFIPERATEFVFPDSDEEEGWYLTGGIYIGLATGFYAFILSFVSLLSVGFAGFNLLNSIRERRKKESKIHAPTKREEPFSRFHPETMVPLLVNVFALFWGSFNLNLLIRDSVQWDIHIIWKISSHIVLFFAILFHIYFLTQKSASKIGLRKETIEVRGLHVSLIPLLVLFLVDFIVPENYWDIYSGPLIIYLVVLCTLWIISTVVKSSMKWSSYSTFSSIFFFCSMIWFGLQPDFAAFFTGYLVILIIVAVLLVLILISGYEIYPFSLMMIVSLNIPHLAYPFQPTFSVFLFVMMGAYILYYEGGWLMFQRHMSTQARSNVLMVLALKPSSRIDRRRKSEIEALEELVQEGVIECISNGERRNKDVYKIKSEKWEAKLLDMATDKEWLEEISEETP